MKKYFVFIALFILPLLALSSDSLLVYQVSGSVTTKRGNTSIVLKTGNKIPANAAVILGKTASISFICESYVSFTVNKPGTHLLGGYVAQCKRSETNVTSKYFKYVWEQFTHPHASPESQHREFMKNAGGVSRGCAGFDLSTIPDTINFTGKPLNLVWQSDIKDATPLVYLLPFEKNGNFKERLAVSEIFSSSKNRISFKTLSAKIKYGNSYEWSIGIKDQEVCDTKVINSIDAAAFKKKEAELKKMIVKSNAAEEAFMMASLLATEYYFDAATSYYEKAVQLAPKSKRYKAALNTHRAVFGL